MVRLRTILLTVFVGTGCVAATSCLSPVALEGFRCDEGRCEVGFVCDPLTDTCVGIGERGDGGGGDLDEVGSGGDIAGADTVGGDFLVVRGDTRIAGGDTFTPGSDDFVTGGDSFIAPGDTLGGDALGGDAFLGDTARGDTLRGDTLRGDPLRGDDFVCTSSAQCVAGFCCGGSCLARGTDCDGWLDTDWAFRRTVTVQSSLVTTTGAAHADFPVALAIDDSTMTAAGRVGGADIVVTEFDGVTPLAHEVERFAPTGEVVIWVKVPRLSSVVDVLLYVYYGNPTAVDSARAAEVWSAGYEAVWHMNQSPGPGASGDIIDSLGVNHATAQSSMANGDLVPSQLGLGIDFDGNDDIITSNNTIGLSGNDSFSVQVWIDPGNNPVDNGYGNGLAGWGTDGGSNGNFLYYNSTEQNFESGYYANDGQTAQDYPDNGVYMAFHTYDGTIQRVYVNGSEAMNRNPTGTLTVANSTVKIGRDPFNGQNRFYDGVIDEVRVSSVVRSPEWISTEYANQSDPGSFAVWGSAQTIP